MYNSNQKILIVYYSLGGHTRTVAQKIQEQTGADVYKIRTVKPVPLDFFLYGKVALLLIRKKLPLLKGAMPDLTPYDLIFVGAPVWWYTVPLPLQSFLAKNSFQNKQVIPFVTQEGNSGRFFKVFKKKTREARVQQGLAFEKVEKMAHDVLNQKISDWLDSLKI